MSVANCEEPLTIPASKLAIAVFDNEPLISSAICAELDTNVGLRNYWRSQGTIMDQELEQRQRKLGIHNSERS